MIHIDQDSSSRTTIKYLADVLVALLIAYIAARPIVHAMHHHFFLESDSVAYLGLGANIWAGKGFVDFAGYWCSDWPPLYPFFIGLCKVFTHDGVVAIGLVGGFCFAATILIAYLWLGKLTNSIIVQSVVTLSLAFSVPLTNLANSGLSESLFVPLTIAGIYFIGIYLEKGATIALILSGIAALLCCLTRYIGLSMTAAALCAIIIAPDNSVGKKMRDCCIFSLIAIVPFVGWCAVNKQFTGAWMGERDPGDRTFHQCWAALIDCIQNTLVVDYYSIILACAALIGLAALLYSHKDIRLPYFGAAPFFIVFYAGLLIWSSSTYSIDMVDDRLTYPLFVPLIVVSVGLIEYFRTAIVKPASVVATTAIAGFFFLIFFSSLTQPQVPDGGYLSSEWRNSGTLGFVKTRSFLNPLFTNDSSAIYLFTQKGAECIADDTDSPTMPYVESEFNGVPSSAYIIWLYNGLEPVNFDANAALSKCSLKIVARFSDGVIFQRTGGGSGGMMSLLLRPQPMCAFSRRLY